MEYWDIYDDNRNKTGRTILRSDRDKLGDNENHVAIHVAFFNSKGEMLLQRRSLTKADDPGKWDFSSRGSILVSETPQDGAHRETLEELGIDYDFNNIKPMFTKKYPNVFDDFFIVNLDIDIKDITIQKEELSEVKWITKEEMEELINDNYVIPHVEEYKILRKMLKR